MRKMIVNTQEAVLKGQYNLAQGKLRRSVALGWMEKDKIVRVIAFLKEKSLSRTKEDVYIFPENDILQFRPKKKCLVYHAHSDGFSRAFLTQGDVSVRSSLNYALG